MGRCGAGKANAVDFLLGQRKASADRVGGAQDLKYRQAYNLGSIHDWPYGLE